MIRRFPLLAAAIVVLAAAPADAIKIGDTTVVVPVAIHGPGAQTTQWRTDLWIANSNNVEKDITVTYYPNGGAPASFTVHVGTYSVVEIQDVVLSRFGLDNSKGLLLLRTEGASGFSAHARIFNTGNPIGEFGQFVPGLGQRFLSIQGFLPGVSGIDGNRANMGIANPTDHEISCQVQVVDGDGAEIARPTVAVPATSVVQVNDIFAAWGIAAQGNIQLRVSTATYDDPFYAYASIVRDGSGDAIFIFGTSPNA